MKIYTRRTNKKIDRAELKQAAEFMYACLVPHPPDRKDIQITIEMIYLNDLDWCGFTFVEKKEINKRRPKKFKIQLNARLSRKKQLISLAHELVHVKQFNLNELGFSFQTAIGKLTQWKKRVINEDDQNYFDLPWEIEANGREYGLWRRYENKRKTIKRKKA